MGRGKGSGEEETGLSTRRRLTTPEQLDALEDCIGQLEQVEVALYAGTDYHGVCQLVVSGVPADEFDELEMTLAQVCLRPVAIRPLNEFSTDDVALARAFEQGRPLIDKAGAWEQLAESKLEVKQRAHRIEADLTEQARRGRNG